MTNSSPWYIWPIEIDGLPNLKMVIFHGELLVITRGYMFLWLFEVFIKKNRDFPKHNSSMLQLNSGWVAGETSIYE